MLWQFLIAAVLIELTPGPNMTWLAVMGASKGRGMALSAVAGIGLGLAIAATIAAVGLTAVLDRWPILFQALRWLGAGYLLYLAYDAWRDSTESKTSDSTSVASAFRQGLITNILNPKAYIFYAAALPQFIDSQQPVLNQVILLSAIYVAVATAIHAGIAILAGSAATWLQTSPQAKFIRRILALAIAAAAVWFFFSTEMIK
jgi:threonine/homoserine/homoserine lactone efflux protein